MTSSKHERRNAETETDAVNRVKRFTLIFGWSLVWLSSSWRWHHRRCIGVIHPIAKMTRVMKRLADGEMNDDARFDA